MTKDVIISISGVQITDGDKGGVEMITAGTYYLKNGKHYIFYDEVLEDTEEVIKNTIKISEGGLDIVKKGSSSVHMVFEEHKKNLSCYMTPFGELMVGVDTGEIAIDEQEHELNVKVGYSLDINYEHVSECNIVVNVQSKATAEVHLSAAN